MPKIRYTFNRSKSLIFFVLSSAHLLLIGEAKIQMQVIRIIDKA